MKNLNKLILIVLISIVGISIANAQCTSSFNFVDNGSGNYTFTSTSTGGLNFYWSVDNQYAGTGTSLSNTFVNGTYVVCLAIEDSMVGCFDNSCQTITVTSGIPCNIVAGFTAVDNGLGNYTFTNTSTGNGTMYYWDFGDGNTSTAVNPNYTYSNNGGYTVCLTTSDGGPVFGCSDVFCDSITVTSALNIPCNLVAGFTAVDNGNGNFTFTNTSTGGGFMYWNFGDGNTSTAVNPSHTFVANGTFVVELITYDSICSDYYLMTVTVGNVQSPVACNAAFVIYLDSLTNNVIVINSSTGNNLSYFWDFGDGNTSTLQYPNYTYSTAGPFQLCLTVADSGFFMCTSTYCDSINSGGIILKQSGFTINVIPVTAVGIENEIELISGFEIYPNPVKNNLSITLNLTEQANVEVFVTDLLGKQISVITNEIMPAGNNKLQWTPANISNGIYLLNIKTNNSLQVKKLVLNR